MRWLRVDAGGIIALIERNAVVFSRHWKPTTFAGVVEPPMYLILLGSGLGSLLNQQGDYLQFLAVGFVTITALLSSVPPGMYETFVKARMQATYDAYLSSGVTVSEIIAADAVFLAARSTVFGCVPLVTACAVGLPPTVTMAAIPPILFICACGWASFGAAMASKISTLDGSTYVNSIVMGPLVLTSGAYFPPGAFPGFLNALGVVNPLAVCVQLIRHLASGDVTGSDLGRFAVLAALSVILFTAAVKAVASHITE